MKKTNICISVDFDTLQIAKQKVDNISRYLNECLAGLSGKTAEDRTREQLEEELNTIKGQMQELSIRQSVALQSINAIKEAKIAKAKEDAENEQFKRWVCPIPKCGHKNFMEDRRCTNCNLPSRDSPKTQIISIKDGVGINDTSIDSSE